MLMRENSRLNAWRQPNRKLLLKKMEDILVCKFNFFRDTLLSQNELFSLSFDWNPSTFVKSIITYILSICGFFKLQKSEKL